MTPTSRLYDALNAFLRQCDIMWQDACHLQTLRRMMIGMIQSQNLHLNDFGVYVVSRAHLAQSHQRRFRRWLSNRRIDVTYAHHALIQQALGRFKFLSSYQVCLTLSLPLHPSDNMRIPSVANLPSSDAFRLLSFVSQAAS